MLSSVSRRIRILLFHLVSRGFTRQTEISRGSGFKSNTKQIQLHVKDSIILIWVSKYLSSLWNLKIFVP